MKLPHLFLALIAAALMLPAAASAQTILRYTDHEPLGGMRPQFIKDVLFAAIEKESNGRLKIADNWDSKLATGYDALKTVGAGATADIGIVVPEYTANDLPLHQIFKGFAVGPAGEKQVAFFRRVYDEVPAFPAELRKNNVVPIFLATGYPVAFFSTKTLNSLQDIKGQTWRTASFWHRDFLRNAGANPVSIPWGPEVFNALQGGKLDGLMVNIDSGYMLDVHKVAPRVVASEDLWLGHLYILAMNAKTWDGLAQEDKAAIRRAAETAYKALGPTMDRSFAAMVQDMTRAGVNIRLLAREEVEAFDAAIKTPEVQAAWASAEAKKGTADVAPTLERVQNLLKEAMK